MVFPVAIYGYESWTIKKAENWRIDAFELWCWRRLLSPLESKEIQLVHPKEISPEYSLEGLMLKLKLQYFGHLMQRIDSLKRPWCWERFKVGGEGDDTDRMRWLDGIIDSTDLSKLRGSRWWTRMCCSHMFREINSFRRTMQIVECSLLHRRAQGRVSS